MQDVLDGGIEIAPDEFFFVSMKTDKVRRLRALESGQQLAERDLPSGRRW